MTVDRKAVYWALLKAVWSAEQTVGNLDEWTVESSAQKWVVQTVACLDDKKAARLVSKKVEPMAELKVLKKAVR